MIDVVGALLELAGVILDRGLRTEANDPELVKQRGSSRVSRKADKKEGQRAK